MIARTPYPKALEEFPILRQSTLSTFDDCGLASLFDRRYRKSFSDAASGRGIIWHRWAAKALREMAAQSTPTHIVDHLEVDVALAIFLETLRQADVPLDEIVNIPMREISDLTWMVKKFAHETRWNIAGLVDIEQRLSWTVRYPNPYGGYVERVISGQLDALFAEGIGLERGIVIDYKTGWWLPPRVGHLRERLLPAKVLRAAGDAQPPAVQLDHTARVLPALLAAARGDDLPRSAGRDRGGHQPRWSSGSTAPCRRTSGIPAPASTAPTVRGRRRVRSSRRRSAPAGSAPRRRRRWWPLRCSSARRRSSRARRR